MGTQKKLFCQIAVWDVHTASDCWLSILDEKFRFYQKMVKKS